MNYNKQGYTFQEKLSQIEQDFKAIYRIQDPRFGDVTLMQCLEDSNIIIMRIDYVTQNLQDAQLAFKEAQTRFSLQNPNILQMPDYTFIFQDTPNFSMIVSGYYEYPYWDLQREIQERQKDLSLFPPDEIIIFINDSINALAYLQSKKTIHGDLKPKYFSLRNNQQPYKLLDRFQNTSSPLQIQINNYNTMEPLYVSPQIFKALINHKKQVKYNPYKNEIFSLGLVVLEMSILQSVQNIYDFYTGKINEKFFISLIEKFMETYSSYDILREIFLKMIELDQSKRMDAIELQKFMQGLQNVFLPSENQDQNIENQQIQEPNDYNIVNDNESQNKQSRKVSQNNQDLNHLNYSYKPYRDSEITIENSQQKQPEQKDNKNLKKIKKQRKTKIRKFDKNQKKSQELVSIKGDKKFENRKKFMYYSFKEVFGKERVHLKAFLNQKLSKKKMKSKQKPSKIKKQQKNQMKKTNNKFHQFLIKKKKQQSIDEQDYINQTDLSDYNEHDPEMELLQEKIIDIQFNQKNSNQNSNKKIVPLKNISQNKTNEKILNIQSQISEKIPQELKKETTNRSNQDDEIQQSENENSIFQRKTLKNSSSKTKQNQQKSFEQISSENPELIELDINNYFEQGLQQSSRRNLENPIDENKSLNSFHVNLSPSRNLTALQENRLKESLRLKQSTTEKFDTQELNSLKDISQDQISQKYFKKKPRRSLSNKEVKEQEEIQQNLKKKHLTKSFEMEKKNNLINIYQQLQPEFYQEKVQQKNTKFDLIEKYQGKKFKQSQVKQKSVQLNQAVQKKKKNKPNSPKKIIYTKSLLSKSDVVSPKNKFQKQIKKVSKNQNQNNNKISKIEQQKNIFKNQIYETIQQPSIKSQPINPPNKILTKSCINYEKYQPQKIQNKNIISNLKNDQKQQTKQIKRIKLDSDLNIKSSFSDVSKLWNQTSQIKNEGLSQSECFFPNYSYTIKNCDNLTDNSYATTKKNLQVNKPYIENSEKSYHSDNSSLRSSISVKREYYVKKERINSIKSHLPYNERQNTFQYEEKYKYPERRSVYIKRKNSIFKEQLENDQIFCDIQKVYNGKLQIRENSSDFQVLRLSKLDDDF